MFQPVAVVGQACVLPGALDVAQFADNVFRGRDVITDAPSGRWGMSDSLGEGRDRAWSSAGGYVTGFETVWDPSGFGLPAAELAGLDPLTPWLLHVGRSALRSAGLDVGDRRLARCGAIFGNLSFPTEGMARWGEHVTLTANGRSAPDADARDRFMSGLPADLLARGLGLGAPTFALDAACASSLYAIRLACDALVHGRADLMLAGAVQRADSLFLHIGFCALGAMSRLGKSRPFHRGADGLVPAEGCALIVLKRLTDAVRDGDVVLGVIRGVGLSNDGRARNLLAPSEEGQIRALRAAYLESGLSPADIQLVECHATGTPTGDKTEIATLSAVFGSAPLPIGSLKSMVGHLITAAGAAGLQKVLAGFARQSLPPTLHGDAPIPSLEASSFRLVHQPEPWLAPVRRACVSAFGFGGNNAHLIVEEFVPGAPVAVAVSPPRARVAVVGLAVAAGAGDDRVAFAADLDGSSPPRASKRDTLTLPLDGLRFPPKDLGLSLPQQTLLLRVALDAVAEAGVPLPREETGVYVGMGADVVVGGYGLRWRLGDRLGLAGVALERARDAVIPALRAENVVGTMPNIPANRLNVQLDVGGPGFTLSAEELSGVAALAAGLDSVSTGALDVAVVGAVDLACDTRHTAALAALGVNTPAQDAAVIVLLERLDDAVSAGHTVWAVLDDIVIQGAGSSAGPPVHGIACPTALGHAHAAMGLLDVAAAVLTVARGAPSARTARTSLGGATAHTLVSRFGTPVIPERPFVSGSMLTFPAHEAEIRLPQDSPLRMAKAPALPSILHAWAPVAATRAAPAEPAPAAVAAATGDEGARPLSDPILATFLAQQARVTAVHRAFLEQQAAVQSRFAAARSASTRMLLEAAGMPAGSHPHIAPTYAPPTPVLAVGPATGTPAASIPPSLPEAAAASTATLPGPKFSRAALVDLSRGPVSTHLGPAFSSQDRYDRVVRMPEPPLLLCDRVLGIEGPATKLGKGTIWTETDVGADAWYLHERRMPAGVMIEAGQADLLLVSWQGIDLTNNRGERMYRLLGCDLRYEGGLPTVGDTLRYDIHVDGHAKLGDIRMFFFHYDCRIGEGTRLTVREGQAGFFSAKELLDSGGVLWDAATAELDLTGPLAPPVVVCEKTSFSNEDLLAFTEGRIRACFGPAFHYADTHTRTPRIAGGKLLFFDRVTEFSATGGPWRRGYLRAEADIRPDHWFFDGHFHNDPCMPGTLMFEGCLQALQVYLTALGHTVSRDGWRFEPRQGETFHLRCRGQVIPTSKLLTYELFVMEVGLEPVPYVKAQVMCTVDGLKCFHADPLTLVMVPDWPLTRMPELLADYVEPKPCVWDYTSLLSCAWGPPSAAFGKMYEVFDGTRRVARLPGPPYHFMSRVTYTDCPIGVCKAGGTIEIEYDVPPRDWYFYENSNPTMPFAVLLEAALQPCGWLASYVGSALTSEGDLLFRNLDGTGTLHREIRPDGGTLVTRVKITSVNRSAGMIIESFEVKVTMGGQPLYDMKTVFGFFPPAAFENQVGVGSEAPEREWLASTNDFFVDLTSRPARYCSGALRMPSAMLCMLDRVTGYWPTGGKAGLGRWRAEKDVDSTEWFFKAHFYQDPVQPGSLGIEAMIQLAQFIQIHTGVGDRFEEPRFEPIALGSELKWKYRGQVVPRNVLIQTELEITKIEGDTLVCEAHLWVDGKRIYSAWNLGMRVVEGAGGPQFPFDHGANRPSAPVTPPEHRSGPGTGAFSVPVPIDHCPTYVLPALPAMTMVMLALQAAAAPALRDVSVLRWLSFPEGPRLVTASVAGDKVTLSASEYLGGGAKDAPFFVATACALMPPVELPPLRDGVAGPDGPSLYASGELFHGPGFQVVEQVVARGSNGATLLLRAAPPDVLLDGITHGVPHDRLETWCPEITPGQVGYPSRVEAISLYGAPPRGSVRCEVRFLGMVSGRPRIGAHLYDGASILASVVFQEVLLPQGRIGRAAPSARRDFLLGHPDTGVSLSAIEGHEARLSPADVRGSDWLPGTMARVFGTNDAVEIATKEIAGRLVGAHPREVRVGDGTAWGPRRPLRTVSVTPMAGGVHAQSMIFPDMSRVTSWWRTALGAGAWPGEELVAALAQRYLGDLVVHDPDAMERLRGRPMLFLGNHENYLESVIFTCVAPALFGSRMRALAKVEHRERWLGELEALLTSYPGHEQDPFIVWFDQKDPASLPALVAGATDRSLLVHVEGTRQITPGQPVSAISSLWVDVALKANMPVVPVAFRGGLDGVGRHDVPAAPQAHHVGRPILPEELAAAPYVERRRIIAEAINALGVPAAPAPVTTPVDPAAGIRAALATIPSGPFRDMLDGNAPPGAWWGRLTGLVGGRRGTAV